MMSSGNKIRNMVKDGGFVVEIDCSYLSRKYKKKSEGGRNV